MGGSPSALLINILLGSFQLFLHSDLTSLRVIIPFSGVCQSGGCIIRRRRVGSFTHWRKPDCFDVQPTTIAATSSHRAPFSAFTASANSFVYFASSAATSRWHLHVGNCRVRQLQFSGIFVALGFVGNGVITVMINGPWQANVDDADNQSGDNRGDSAHTSISLTVRRFFGTIRLSALCSNWP